MMLAFVASVLALTLNIWLLFNVRQAGLPVGFAFGLMTAAILLVAAVYSFCVLVTSNRHFQKAVSATAKTPRRSKGDLKPGQKYLKWFSATFPGLSRWLGRRLSADSPKGLIVSVAVVAAAALTVTFASIAKDVALRDEIVDLDQYAIGAYVGLRTPLQSDFFQYVTTLAGIEAMAVFLLVLIAIAWQRRVLPLLFGVGLASVVVTTQFLKLVFGRARPDEAFRLVVEHGFSFPSGHAAVATVMFGLAGYVLWRTARDRLGRFLAAAGSVTAIALVGVSRNYLGAHFPSDVLASMALGAAILVLIVAAVETNQRFKLLPQYVLDETVRRPLIIGLLILAIVSVPLTLVTL